jgi:hypothetical protein
LSVTQYLGLAFNDMLNEIILEEKWKLRDWRLWNVNTWW